MSSHLSKQFDLELESIRTRILQMGGLVERQLMAAIDAFNTGNIEAMQEIIRTAAMASMTEANNSLKASNVGADRKLSHF